MTEEFVPSTAKTLPIDLDHFGFVEREKVAGKTARNKCGRDFLYFALHYFFPGLHNAGKLYPREIEQRRIFGVPVADWLAWTQIQFSKMPKYLRSLGAELCINTKPVHTFRDFMGAISFPGGVSCEKGISMIEEAVRNKNAVGVDISVGWGGLLDHVMFVYGYDKENLYVFDTHEAQIEYEKLTPVGDFRCIMRLPKSVVQNRWGKLARVWVVGRRMSA